MKRILITILFLNLTACGGNNSSSPESSDPDPQAASSSETQAEARTPVEPKIPKGQIAKVDLRNFDILGMRLGDSASDIESKLATHTPSLEVRLEEGDFGTINGSHIYGGEQFKRGFYAESTQQYDATGRPIHYKEILSGSYTIPPNEQILTGLSRTLPFREPILRNELVAQLTDKYGNPLYQDGTWLSWSTNLKNEVIDNPRILTSCTPRRWGFQEFRQDFISQAMVPCGYHFTIKFWPAQNPDLIQSMTMMLYDLDMIMSANEKTIAYTKAEADKLRQQEVDAAKGRTKPTL